ncbi:ASST-domain-containing protein [Dactylonectria estremocensis]|uniref:ASST-domain-containing protein n=1 Tax=Dactylonectria estremocensis TaxID=1079267 RepID=A0A9P9EVT3_9HYPO|nr:ASST-domain-containing protein [Dactylonectria estremocensis]
MIAPQTSAWPVRLIAFGCFASCLLVYYTLFSSASYPAPHKAPRPPTSAFRQFPSQTHTKVVFPKDEALWPYWVFKSAPFQPPYFNTIKNGLPVADGYLFLTPKTEGEGHGLHNLPVVMTADNDLVYCYNQNQSAETTDFRVQIVDGKPHLTGWQGLMQNGHGYGEWFMLDDEYNKTTVTLDVNLHNTLGDVEPPGFLDYQEHEVTPEGTLLVTASNLTTADLTGLGGRAAKYVLDNIIYEIDIKTNEVLFTWSALDHFGPGDSKLPLPSRLGDGSERRPYDYFHINSLQAVGDGFLLVSSRHLWSLMLISRTTGSVVWTLDGSGQGGDFGPSPKEAQFQYQHHARVYNATGYRMTVSLFDNHNAEDTTSKETSRALLLDLALPPDGVEPPVVVRNLHRGLEAVSKGQGSYDAQLGNGNQLVGYGRIPVIREYGPSGNPDDVRWQARFGRNDASASYRVSKSSWSATPKAWGPSLFYEKNGADRKAYLSWNGATGVEAWRLYDIELGSKLRPLGWANASGFETVISIPHYINKTECIIAAAVQGGEEVRLSNKACYGS